MNLYVLIAAAGVVLAIVFFVLSLRLAKRSGLPPGKVIYSDTGAWQRNWQSLFSQVYRIVGKPDYLVRSKHAIIPVEFKSGLAPTAPHLGHVLQLAAYCLLVEECLKIRPTHGIIKYDNREFEIAYTSDLEQSLVRVVSEMRAGARLTDGPHRSHNEISRCKRCGVRDGCSEKL
ncbi:MAG TPA: Dna2/Cas4 domain-containing protein [Anaerolineae bacterium]|jgi:CRISPR-associated exonuclease Cas4